MQANNVSRDLQRKLNVLSSKGFETQQKEECKTEESDTYNNDQSFEAAKLSEYARDLKSMNRQLQVSKVRSLILT